MRRRIVQRQLVAAFVATINLPFTSAVVVLLCSLFAILGGTVTLIGWAFDFPQWTDWGRDEISMLPNTAASVLLCGAALLLVVSRSGRACLIAGRVLAGLVAAVGGLTLAEHVFQWDLKIDTLIFERPWGQNATTSPMRMGPPASVSFLLLGIAVLLTTYGPARRRMASSLVLLPLAISSLSLIGYGFGADQLFGIARVTAIARQTSSLIVALSIGIAAAIPEHGIVAALRRRDSGGIMLRRLIVPVVLIPCLLGWLHVMAQDANMYDSRFATAQQVLTEVVLMLALLWWTSNSVSHHAAAAQDVRNRLAAIVESSDDAIIGKTLDGTIQSWNYGAEQMFGYSNAEAVGENIRLIIPTDRAGEEIEIVQRLRRGERLANFETVRVCKDGTHLDVSLTISPIRDFAGRIVGASTIARDITQRKLVDEAVRRSEAELQTLANSIPQLAWMANPEGHIFWYNQRWYDFTGTQPEDVYGWGWQSVHDPQHLNAVLDRWKQSLATGEPFEMQFPLRGADGHFRWFLTRVTPLRDSRGKIVRWFGTNTDVDHVKRVEQDLRSHARTLELLVQTGTVVGSTLDLHDLLQAVTDIATQLSGAELGVFYYDADDDQDIEPHLCARSGVTSAELDELRETGPHALFSPLLQGAGPLRSDDISRDDRFAPTTLPRQEARQRKVTVSSYLAVPVVSRMGKVVGSLCFGHSHAGVFDDAKERIVAGVAAQAGTAIDNARLYARLKKAAVEREELLQAERAARTEAERVNSLKDEFLATLSHELRTPLTAILGWAKLLTTYEVSEENLAEGLEAIERNSRAQAQLIDDLLDMSRVVSGKLRLEVETLDLVQIVDQAVESMRHLAVEKNIRLTKIWEKQPAYVMADATRCQQIMWNLLSNAIKFTPQGGHIDVCLERSDATDVTVVVRDSGIGIEPEFLPRIFERFRQADATTSRAYGGLGLGLSIVKCLVELHEGTVEACSQGAGTGTTFRVTFPLAPREYWDQAEKSPSGLTHDTDLEHRLTGITALVVDDDQDARRLLTRMLVQNHADVIEARNAEEALAILSTEQPDVIVSDIGMPDIDGFEFMRRVRQLPPNAGGSIPAVALTAFARPQDRAHALRSGFQLHLVKPVDYRKLLASIAELLKDKRTTADPPNSVSLDCRVLLADDGRDIRYVAEHILCEAGANLVTVADGQQAIDAIEQSIQDGRPFDIVVIDMQMPKVDGYTAVKHIRRAGFDNPIIALTAAALPESQVECARAGCTDFLSKPVDWQKLIVLIHQLGRSASRERT